MFARSQRVMEVFASAVERPETARAEFLAVRCGDDTALRREVDALLAAHSAAEREYPEPVARPAMGERAGDRIGPYVLLEVIGEGGFGVVWMAEQRTPIRRKVALKVLKAGMDTAQVIARFEAERQALALMDHPNIARVLDAGATESGRPYFAMELVRGVPITRFCDELKLSPAERLRLFVPVCEAVQHAHHKGVIHRDLKPSNVLVTLHDGKPVPKVIDFGIAKATSGQLTDRTVFTGFRQMLGTPEYMAPEQAEMSGLDVDTRADVYSLGVVLYEILTGTKPFELAEVIEAGYQELLRRIREVDPEKPSTRVSTLGERVTEIALRRRMLPKGLSSAFRGDVDWIVLKAIEKERGRRYETAHALAEDLERHLRDEPVLAGPPSRAYRLRKYVRRHRLAVAAGGCVLLALLVGVALAGLGYREARWQAEAASDSARESRRQSEAAVLAKAEEQEQRALAEQREREARSAATRAERVTALVQSMLSSSDPHEAKGPGYTVRDLLDDFAREQAGRLEGEPEVESELCATLATSYLGLGLPESAAPHVERALELHRGRLGEGSASYAEALAISARLEHDRGHHDPALERLQAALTIYRDSGEGATLRAAGAIELLADLLGHLGRIDEAEAAVGDLRALHAQLGHEEGIADACSQLASFRLAHGDFDAAESLARDGLARQRHLHGTAHPSVAGAEYVLARVLDRRMKLPEAEELGWRAYDAHCAAFGARHPESARTLVLLSRIRAERGDSVAAAVLAGEALSVARGMLGDEHPLLIDEFLPALYDAYSGLGDQVRAEECARLTLDLRRKLHGDDHWLLMFDCHNLGAALAARGDLAGAEELYCEGLDVAFVHDIGDGNPHVARLRLGLAQVEASRGEVAAATRHYRQGIDALRQLEVEKGLSAHPLMEFACFLLRQGGAVDRAEAERCLRESIASYSALEAPGSDLQRAKFHLAGLLDAQGDQGEAAALLRDTAEVLSRELGDADAEVDVNRCLQVQVLCDLGRAGEAEPVARLRVAVARSLVPADAGRLSDASLQLARCVLLQHRAEEAERLIREWRGLRAVENGSPPHLESLSLLGGALLLQGRLGEAGPPLVAAVTGYPSEWDHHRNHAEAVERAVQLFAGLAAEDAGSLGSVAGEGREEPVSSQRMRALVSALMRDGHFTAAVTVLDYCVPRYRRRADMPPVELATWFATHANVLLEVGRFPEAELLARDALAIRAELQRGEWPHYNALAMLGRAQLGQGRLEEAEPLLVEACSNMRPPEQSLRHLRSALRALINVQERLDRLPDAAVSRTRLEALPPERADSLRR